MNIKRKGILVVVSGFSGAGKGTIMKRLLKKFRNQYALSVSATTRSPREGESHGREYFFVSADEFESMIAKDELIEYAKYVNNYYGTPRTYVEQHLALGMDVILEIEIQGALKVKKKYPDALLLFVAPPSAEELKRRLEERGTEDETTIRSRLSRAVEESVGIEEYDYYIVNDDLEDCVAQVHSIIEGEPARITRNLSTIEKMKQELSCLVKGE